MSAPRPDRDDLTHCLNQWARGGDVPDTFMTRVHAELRVIAESNVPAQNGGHTLQPTALVNEAFVRLFDTERVSWNDRKHFFALSAKVMRQILVDHARARGRLKRGGGQLRVTLDSRIAARAEPDFDMIDLDQILEKLSIHDERQGRIVELRFFGGLDVQEVADELSLSKSTVEREWRAARAWLGVRLEGWSG